jgi:hypothetical protein
MSEGLTTHDLSPGMKVKTQANDIVPVVQVRHFNDTVAIGQRGASILVSLDEISEIIEE